VRLSGPGSTGNLLLDDYVGTDAGGTLPLGNGSGVVLDGGAWGNTVGTPAAQGGNLVSANLGAGITVGGPGTSGNLVQGNYVGTDVYSSVALGNGGAGVLLTAAGNTLGGTGYGAGNVISGNAGPGVLLRGPGATANLLANNRVGTDVGGAFALGNAVGVLLGDGASGNTVGLPVAQGGNLVSGNVGAGVTLDGAATSGNLVQGNYVGTDLYGAAPLGNGGPGIYLSGASGNTVGGAAPLAGNLVSGNLGHGVLLDGGASADLVAGNVVGTDLGLALVLGNGGDGVVLVASSGNLVAGNVIAYNGADGVLVDGGAGDGVLGNAIYGHPGLGIELANGGNHGQPFPTLAAAGTDGSRVTIRGTLTAAPGTAYTLEFFANALPNASGFGEGEAYLGSGSVVTDGQGNATFTFAFAAAVDPSYCVSATATDPGDNTSQFSLCVSLSGGGDAPPRAGLPPAAGEAGPGGRAASGSPGKAAFRADDPAGLPSGDAVPPGDRGPQALRVPLRLRGSRGVTVADAAGPPLAGAPDVTA
jgi:hypothetical protein